MPNHVALALEIVESQKTALEQFQGIQGELQDEK
jgi:hypothetical protein